MEEYGAAIVSLSQDRNFSTPASDEDEDEDVSHQSPHPRSSYNFKVVKLEPVRHRSVELEPITNADTSSNHNNNSDHQETMSTMMMMGSRKKPRGRPPGSKNKPRAPVVFRQECHSAMKTVVIEISTGADVVDTLVNFARRRRVGVSVLSGCGSVSKVTLRRPLVQSHSHAPPSQQNMMTLHGPFNLLSLSGSVVESLGCSSSFGVCLAGTQGQMFGGIVGGGVIAAGLVVVVAATFLKPRFHKLPAGPSSEDDDEEDIKPYLLSNIAEETTTTTSCGFGGDGSGSVAAMSTGCYGGVMSSPQPMLQPVTSTWGGHPPFPPPY